MADKKPVETKKREFPGVKKVARVNPSPRQYKVLTDRQRLFIYEYLVDMDPSAAYIRAGYEDSGNKASIYTSACRLLKNAKVMEEIDRLQVERLNKLGIDAEWAIIRFKLIYLEAMKRRELSNACRALENIGKHLGIYEKDNKQKTSYSEADLEKLKQELKEAGFTFDRINFASEN